MINVSEICAPGEAWVRRHGGDTPAQAQLRACLIAALEGLDDIETITVGADLINVMRDELMGAAATARKLAAVSARQSGMKPDEIAAASGQTFSTVQRLLVRGNRRRGSTPDHADEAIAAS